MAREALLDEISGVAPHTLAPRALLRNASWRYRFQSALSFFLSEDQVLSVVINSSLFCIITEDAWFLEGVIQSLETCAIRQRCRGMWERMLVWSPSICATCCMLDERS